MVHIIISLVVIFILPTALKALVMGGGNGGDSKGKGVKVKRQKSRLPLAIFRDDGN